ncbi:MAG TPA: RNA polymerase sigma factor [Thermoanaerobaculia bacterium]|jgi:RNA polymerase sigma-70 factor (ECF subfamily)|nr:RNA polymerase sigma factor [Thermoanaerobaculia bacterium]
MNNDDRFQALYRKFYKRMVRFYVLSFRVSEEDAEELTQEAFVRFFEAMDEYRGDAEWAYLEMIARNVAYNRIRSQKTAKRGAEIVDIHDRRAIAEPAAPAEPDYAQREEAAIRSKRLRDAIAELPTGSRECIQLWLNEFTYDEIAKFLRTTVDAVKSRLRDAKKMLRAKLGDPNALPEVEE